MFRRKIVKNKQKTRFKFLTIDASPQSFPVRNKQTIAFLQKNIVSISNLLQRKVKKRVPVNGKSLPETAQIEQTQARRGGETAVAMNLHDKKTRRRKRRN